nr:hypothetical protein MarFTME_023 [Marseillevirus futianmevirus]
MEFFLSPRDFLSFSVCSPLSLVSREEKIELSKKSCSVDIYDVEKLLSSDSFPSDPLPYSELGVFSKREETTLFIQGTNIKHGEFFSVVTNTAKLPRHPYVTGGYELRGKTRIVTTGHYLFGKLHGEILKKWFVPFHGWKDEVQTCLETFIYYDGFLISKRADVFLLKNAVGYFPTTENFFSD